jgi:hypothetical protein
MGGYSAKSAKKAAFIQLRSELDKVRSRALPEGSPTIPLHPPPSQPETTKMPWDLRKIPAVIGKQMHSKKCLTSSISYNIVYYTI